jgi:hypothetical protein
VQARVFSFVHHAHATTAEAFEDVVAGKSSVDERIGAKHLLHISSAAHIRLLREGKSTNAREMERNGISLVPGKSFSVLVMSYRL